MNEENAKKLVKLLKSKGFDFENVAGFVLTLNTDEKINQMINFIEQNVNAERDDIFNKLYEIMEIKTFNK